MGKVLRQDQIRFFKENGYLVADDIFELEEIDETLNHFNLSFVQQLERRQLPVEPGATLDALHQNMATLLEADVELYLATLRMCSKLYGIYRLMTSGRLRGAAEDLGVVTPLFSTTPVLHPLSNRLLIPGGYHGYEVHQDWPSIQSSLDAMTAWFPLMNVEAGMYTMEFIPGSHLKGLLSGVQEEHYYLVDDKHFREKDFEPIQVRKGGVCLLSHFVVHRTSPRGDNRLRIAISGRYENASEPSFVARNYPFTQVKTMRRGFITENFPPRELVQEVYRIK